MFNRRFKVINPLLAGEDCRQSLSPNDESPCMLVAELLKDALSSKEISETALQSSWQMMKADYVYWCISGITSLPKALPCDEDERIVSSSRIKVRDVDEEYIPL